MREEKFWEKETFDRHFREKEQEIATLQEERYQAEHSLAYFSQELDHNFRELQQLEEEQFARVQRKKAFSEIKEKKKYRLQMLETQQESLAFQYKQAIQTLEAEQEILERERRNQTWD